MNKALSSREKVLLLILVCILIGVGYFKLIYEPTTAKIENFKSMESAELDQIVTLSGRVQKKNQMVKAIEEAKANPNVKPLPNFDNIKPLLIELDAIFAPAIDYQLKFDNVYFIEKNYVAVRPITATFKTPTYEEGRKLIDALYANDNLMQISDLSYSWSSRTNEGYYQFTIYITYFELNK